MREIKQKELLQLQLDILKYVDSYCRLNKIEYFLVGGTGIGAIRHGGYIPWDDDIDIGMTRPNYNKFILSFNGKYSNLVVKAPELDWNYYAPYANVCDNRTILYEGANGHNGIEVGVKIDIFPYDAVPSSKTEFDELRKKSLKLLSMTETKRWILLETRPFKIRWIIKLLIKKIILLPWSYSNLQKKINKLTKVTLWDNAMYLEKIVFPYKDNTPCKREIFESYCDIKFEDLTVRNLVHYDEYLRSVFGDYMQLPPEEHRVAHHGFTAYWIV